MESIPLIVGFIVCVPWIIDAAIRRVLSAAASSANLNPQDRESSPTRWLAIVPARAEGAAVLPTLRSIQAAAGGHLAETIVLVDGCDLETEESAAKLGMHVVIKEPAGPTKGSALRWLVEHHMDVFDEIDAVLILDVGSRIGTDFFDRVGWNHSTLALQSWLTGVGDGVGGVAAFSERMAQQWQDCGRQALGWSVHLRGTGMVLDPSVLKDLAPRLWTSIEDTEATLLLAADGVQVVLGNRDALVEDIKPTRTSDAAHQRSRWLLGKLSLLVHQGSTVVRLVVRRPLEGLAFLSELLSRPYSLTAVLRALLAVLLSVALAVSHGGYLTAVFCAALFASLFSDVLLLRQTSDLPLQTLSRVGVKFLLTWLGAIALLPSASLGWSRGRRR